MNKILRPFLSILVIAAFLSVGTYANGDTGSVNGKLTGKPGKFLKNTVVYIEKVEGDLSPPEKHAVMDQAELVFIPHVLPIIKGTTVDYLNSDDVRHNVFSADDVADKMNLGTWPKGEIRSFTFNKPGVATMLCNVHPEMEAYIVVLQNNHYAITKKDGNYTIENVPPGEYTLKVWNKKYKSKDQKIEIKSGETLSVDFKLKR